MKTKQTDTVQNKPFSALIVGSLIAIVLSGLAGYGLAYNQYNPNKTPTHNTPGYITEEEARNQVSGFYDQYLNPKKDSPVQSREAYIASYGTANLVFYSKYYQHGFDPIVCSATMPTKILVKRVQPGAGAVVTAEAEYANGSKSNIVLTLVLNNKGFGIDTITCPGDKGNLPPQS